MCYIKHSNIIQAGVVSYGVPCAIGYPEVYARVSEFQTWITSKVSGASVGFVTFNSSGSDADSNVVCQQQTSATTAAPPNRAVSSELSVAVILAMFLLQRFM